MLMQCPTFGLVFDEAAHVYTVDGVRLPSVTQILDPLGDLDKVAWATLEKARIRGTRVHTMIEYFETDDLDETYLDEELAGYLNSYKRFKAQTGFEPIIVEGRTWSRLHGYAGSFDLFGRIDGHYELIDTKSGMVPKTARAQTAAYKQLGVEAGVMPRSTRRRCLDLKANDYKLTDEYRGGDDLELFLAALTIHNWKTKNKGTDR
jgi:hypothetical protein